MNAFKKWMLAAVLALTVISPIAAIADQQVINLGSGSNTGTGEGLRSGGVKINANFAELYASVDALQAAIDAVTSGKQPLDADLTAIAGLTSAADRVPYFTGSGTASLATFTSFARSLVDDADAAAARATTGAAPLAATFITQTANSELSGEQALGALGTGLLKNTTSTGVLSIAAAGTDYQGVDAELTSIAGLTSAADRVPYYTGSGTASLATFTSFGRSLVDDADAATARTTLGISAANTSYSNATSGLSATTSQAAIDELAGAATLQDSDTIDVDTSVPGDITLHAKSSAVRLIGTIVTDSVSTSQNDYTPAGWSEDEEFVWTGTSSIQISGFHDGGIVAGAERIIRNASSSDCCVLILPHESTLSTSARRLSNPNQMPIFLFPGDMVTYRYTGTKWRYKGGASLGTMNLTTFYDFVAATGLSTSTNSGAGTSLTIDTTSNWSRFEQGTLNMTTGTTTTGRVWAGSAGSASIVPTKGAALAIGKVSATVLPDGTETYTLQLGFSNQPTGTYSNAVCYELGWSGSASVLNTVVADNNSFTRTASAISMTADTAVVLGVFENPTWTRASFFYSTNGTDFLFDTPVTTGMPSTTARQVAVGAGMTKSAGSTARIGRLDYMAFRIDSVRH